MAPGDVLQVAKHSETEGHFLTRYLNMADAVAQFFALQFRLRGNSHEAGRELVDSLGLASREDLEKLSEELDRLEGLMAAYRRNS